MATTTQAPPQQQGQQPQTAIQVTKNLNVILETRKAELMRALPKHIDVEKLIRVALTTVGNDQKLLTCDPITIYQSILLCAQVGLVPDGFMGEAYLVPFWNNKRNVREAKFMAGYRGLIKLAIQTGRVDAVRAKVVYENDHFIYEEGLVKKLIHRPTLNTSKRGAIIGAYAVAALKDVPPEQHEFVVMSSDDIEAIRLRSQNGHDDEGHPIGSWKTDWPEMAKKTCVRSLCKYLQLSPELTKAVVADEYNELGITLDGQTGEVVQDDRPAVPNVTDKAGSDLRERIANAKTGTTAQSQTVQGNAQPKQEPQKEEPKQESRPTQATRSSAGAAAAGKSQSPDFELIKDAADNILGVKGLVSKVSELKAMGNGHQFRVHFKGAPSEHRFGFGCWHTTWQDFLKKEGLNKVCMFSLVQKDKYLNVEGIRTVDGDDVEMIDGKPAKSIQIRKDIQENYGFDVGAPAATPAAEEAKEAPEPNASDYDEWANDK